MDTTAPHLDMSSPRWDVSSPRWDEDDNDDGLGIGSYFRGGRRAYGVGRQAVMITNNHLHQMRTRSNPTHVVRYLQKYNTRGVFNFKKAKEKDEVRQKNIVFANSVGGFTD